MDICQIKILMQLYEVIGIKCNFTQSF